MIPYLGGDDVTSIVADFGHYSTKIGFAGEDSPRARFRSEVAVQRKAQGQQTTKNNSSDDSCNNRSSDRKGSISSIQYDFMSRPLNFKAETDDGWEPFNPIDPLSGLLRMCDDPDHPSNIMFSSSKRNYSESSRKGSHKSEMINKDINKNNMEIKNNPSFLPPLWTHMMSHGLTTSLLSNSKKLSSTPILIAEKSYNPPSIRQQMTEILFEYMDAPAVFLARDAVLSCYACGRTTGVVVDVGHLGSTVTPVFDGFVEQQGIIRSPIGAAAMDEHVLQRLDKHVVANLGRGKECMPLYQVRSKDKNKRADVFHRLTRLNVATAAREELALTADIGYDAQEHVNSGRRLPKYPYQLPDGTLIDIESEERYNITELFFGRDDGNTHVREEYCFRHNKQSEAAALAAENSVDSIKSTKNGINSNISKETNSTSNQSSSSAPGSANLFSPVPMSSHPLPNIICDSAFLCDRDQQAQLLGNVILSGGGSCSEYFPDRIREEVEGIIHTHTPGWKVKVLAPPIPERSVGAWLGGSILASLGSFNEMWMTKKEYEEVGSALVNRKCP